MKRFTSDDSGQIHTIEGIVSGMIILLALTYIIGSITFISPQTEKTTVMEMSVKSQDLLNALSTPDQPGNYSNPLQRSVAQWKGGIANETNIVNPGEPSIIGLNDKIQSLLPNNTLYNMYLMYINDSKSAVAGYPIFDHELIVFNGDPHDNAVTSSKMIVLNYYDVNSTLNTYWNKTMVPKNVEVQLALWYI